MVSVGGVWCCSQRHRSCSCQAVDRLVGPPALGRPASGASRGDGASCGPPLGHAEEALAWANTDRLDVAISELSDIAKEVYVTLGAQGARVVSRSGIADVAGDPRTPIDTNGAGDMFSGACLAARLRGALPEDSARFANHAAGQVIMQFGARLPSLEDYLTLKDRYMSS